MQTNLVPQKKVTALKEVTLKIIFVLVSAFVITFFCKSDFLGYYVFKI